jgi:hypothetical protein
VQGSHPQLLHLRTRAGQQGREGARAACSSARDTAQLAGQPRRRHGGGGRTSRRWPARVCGRCTTKSGQAGACAAAAPHPLRHVLLEPGDQDGPGPHLQSAHKVGAALGVLAGPCLVQHPLGRHVHGKLVGGDEALHGPGGGDAAGAGSRVGTHPPTLLHSPPPRPQAHPGTRRLHLRAPTGSNASQTGNRGKQGRGGMKPRGGQPPPRRLACAAG